MAKTFSFACIHFTVAFTVGYLMTGSIAVGGALALVEPLCNTVAYHLHERAWAAYARRKAVAEQPDHGVTGTAVPA
jgi:Predicted membrane protein